jgi:homoaconitate hydratase
MGSRDAACYLASPAVVAASAAAGHVTAPEAWPLVEPRRRFTELAAAAAASERVEIIPGFPASLRGRLLFLPQDNLNTDGSTARTTPTRSCPARRWRAVMANYTRLPQRRRPVTSWSAVSTGTGSSREQAVTALQAAGIPLVVAGSFSQTYLRNAFNNGFLCLEIPALVERLRAVLADAIAAGERTIVPGDSLEIDFTASTLALGSVPQSLVIAGGVENLVRRRL